MQIQRDTIARILARLQTPGGFSRNVGNTFLMQVLSLVVSMGNAAVIARVLGAEGKGVLQLALMIPAILSLFLSGGIGVANIHFIGRRQYDVATLTANAMSFTLIATVLGALLTAVLIATGTLDQLIPGVPIGLFLLALSSLPFALLSGHLATILQGLQQIRAVNNIRLWLAISNLLLLIVFLYGMNMGTSGAIYASVLATFTNLLMLAWHLRKEGATFAPRWDKGVMKATLLFGLRGYFGNILQYFNYRLDVFIVNFILGPVSVGIYSVATKLAELVWYFPNAVSFVIFPKSAATKASEMNRFTPRVFWATLLISMLASVALTLIARPMIRLIYTDAFSAAFWPLVALLPGVVLLGAGRVLTSDIAGRGYPQYNSISSATTLILTIVLDVMLIPRQGILGASLASSVAYTFTFVMTLWFYRTVSRRDASPSLTTEIVH